MEIIKSLDKLKILVFWKIVEDQNNFLLDPDYFEGKEYSTEEQIAINETWMRLYDEYYELEDNPTTKAVLIDQSKMLLSLSRVNYLIESMNFIMYICNLSLSLSEDEFNTLLQKAYATVVKFEPKIRILYFGDISENLETIGKWISALQTQHEMKFKQSGKDIKRRINNVYERVAAVGIAIGPMQLNANEINCLEWLAYQKIAQRKNLPKTKVETPKIPMNDEQ